MNGSEPLNEIRDTSSLSIAIIRKIMKRAKDLNTEEIILTYKTITQIEINLLALDRCLDLESNILQSNTVNVLNLDVEKKDEWIRE